MRNVMPAEKEQIPTADRIDEAGQDTDVESFWSILSDFEVLCYLFTTPHFTIL